MAPVTLATLYDLGTLHKETLMVLVRFYLGVDEEIPPMYLPVLLGEKAFPVEHAPKDAAEKWVRILLGVLYAAMPIKGRAAFLYAREDGSFVVSTAAARAIDEYIQQNAPVEDAMLMTLQQWRKSEEYLTRFGDWDD